MISDQRLICTRRPSSTTPRARAPSPVAGTSTVARVKLHTFRGSEIILAKVNTRSSVRCEERLLEVLDPKWEPEEIIAEVKREVRRWFSARVCAVEGASCSLVRSACDVGILAYPDVCIGKPQRSPFDPEKVSEMRRKERGKDSSGDVEEKGYDASPGEMRVD